MKILVVSEGSHELGDDHLQGALVVLSSRLLHENATFVREKVSSRRVRVHIQPGKGGGYEKRALGWIHLAEREGYDALMHVIDQDGQRVRELEFDRAQHNSSLVFPRALGVAIKTFDAWMLADEQALSTVLRTHIATQPAPESEADPKKECEHLRNAADSRLGLTEMYAEIAKVTDVEKLESRCPNGFAPFARRVRSLAIEP